MPKIIIDTSSLLSLVRYYLPFDNQNILKDFVHQKFISGEILFLDAVFEECRYNSQGIILKELDFLESKTLQFSTQDLIPTKKFFNMLENQFCEKKIKKNLKPEEYENRERTFFDSADYHLILYVFLNKEQEDIAVVTEETKLSNDGKVFKKIPAICEIMDVDCITLPKLLTNYSNLKLHYHINP